MGSVESGLSMEYFFSWSLISKERKDTRSGKTAAQATVQPQKDRKGEAIS